MKLYFAASKTPLLDLGAIAGVAIFYLGWIAEPLMFWLFGVSFDASPSDIGMGYFLLTLGFCCLLMFILMGFSLYFTRYIASRFFGVKTGDGYVEWDIKNNESKVVINGKEDNDY